MRRDAAPVRFWATAVAAGLVVAGSAVAPSAAAPTGPAGHPPRDGAELWAGSGSPPTAGVTYTPPISPLRVVRPFQAPATPFGPGHRGVDLASSPNGAVRTAAAGTVSFAGQVVNRGVVVVAHADGVRTEYEPVRPAVQRGQRVRAGQVIGVVSGRHGTCAPGRCLHWGARRGDTYFDPLLLLRPLGPVRLLPWHVARGP